MKHIIKAVGTVIVSTINAVAVSAGAAAGVIATLALIDYGEQLVLNKQYKEKLKKYEAEETEEE